MKLRRCYAFLWAGCTLAALLLAVGNAGLAADTSKKEARVTRVIREVKLLPSKSAPRPAGLNDKVNEDTGVRTGDDSRSELTFVDLTITRLGANTVFSFANAGRSVDLGSGSVLLRVPKDSGGARMTTSAVTVGITGTTLILESRRAGHNKLTVLEGGARLTLRKYPKESVTLRAGQLEDVPPGATKLPPPVNVDVDQIMKTNPLITDFAPLPSRDLIYSSRGTASPPGPPGPGFLPPIPILPGIIGGGGSLPTFGGSSKHGQRTTGTHKEGTSTRKEGTSTHNEGTKAQGASSQGWNPKSGPSPGQSQTPSKKSKKKPHTG